MLIRRQQNATIGVLGRKTWIDMAELIEYALVSYQGVLGDARNPFL